jgi:hypothetical protein
VGRFRRHNVAEHRGCAELVRNHDVHASVIVHVDGRDTARDLGVGQARRVSDVDELRLLPHAAIQIHAPSLRGKHAIAAQVGPLVGVGVGVGARLHEFVVRIPVPGAFTGHANAALESGVEAVIEVSISLNKIEEPVQIEVDRDCSPAEALRVQYAA